MRLFNCIWLNRCVFYASLIAGCLLAFDPAPGGLQATVNDKLLHTFGFMGIAFLAQLAHPSAQYRWHVVGLITFGILIELVQFFIPQRSFSLWDLAADSLGIGVYYLALAPLISTHVLKYRFAPD